LLSKSAASFASSITFLAAALTASSAVSKKSEWNFFRNLTLAASISSLLASSETPRI
jgi:hypothetical protein